MLLVSEDQRALGDNVEAIRVRIELSQAVSQQQSSIWSSAHYVALDHSSQLWQHGDGACPPNNNRQMGLSAPSVCTPLPNNFSFGEELEKGTLDETATSILSPSEAIVALPTGPQASLDFSPLNFVVLMPVGSQVEKSHITPSNTNLTRHIQPWWSLCHSRRQLLNLRSPPSSHPLRSL